MRNFLLTWVCKDFPKGCLSVSCYTQVRDSKKNVISIWYSRGKRLLVITRGTRDRNLCLWIHSFSALIGLLIPIIFTFFIITFLFGYLYFSPFFLSLLSPLKLISINFLFFLFFLTYFIYLGASSFLFSSFLPSLSSFPPLFCPLPFDFFTSFTLYCFSFVFFFLYFLFPLPVFSPLCRPIYSDALAFNCNYFLRLQKRIFNFSGMCLKDIVQKN